MSGRPHIKITESVENLREILKQQKRVLAYNKVQMLYLFQSKQVETVREVSAVLGKSEGCISVLQGYEKRVKMKKLVKPQKRIS
jgi:hypothetical protein